MIRQERTVNEAGKSRYLMAKKTSAALTHCKAADVFIGICKHMQTQWSLSGFLYPAGLHKEDHTDDKEDSQRDDTDVYVSGKLAHDADEHGAEEGSAFAADIIEAEVFAGLFRRDDLGEVRAGQGLYATLEHAYHYSQDPELELGVQEESEDGDAGISGNANGDQPGGRITVGEIAKEQGEGEGHELGHQQCQQKSGGIKP